MTFLNFWLDLGQGDGDGPFYSLDTAWTGSPHFVSLDRGNQLGLAGGVMAGTNISPVCRGQLSPAPGPDHCPVSPPPSFLLPPASTLSTISQISHVFTPGNWIQYNNDKWLALLARHNISISHDTLPLSPDCQIFCSKLVNSLQQGQSMARADGSHLINCLSSLLSPHPRERWDRHRATANTGIYNHQQSVSLVIRNKKTWEFVTEIRHQVIVAKTLISGFSALTGPESVGGPTL